MLCCFFFFFFLSLHTFLDTKHNSYSSSKSCSTWFFFHLIAITQFREKHRNRTWRSWSFKPAAWSPWSDAYTGLQTSTRGGRKDSVRLSRSTLKRASDSRQYRTDCQSRKRSWRKKRKVSCLIPLILECLELRGSFLHGILLPLTMKQIDMEGYFVRGDIL